MTTDKPQKKQLPAKPTIPLRPSIFHGPSFKPNARFQTINRGRR